MPHFQHRPAPPRPRARHAVLAALAAAACATTQNEGPTPVTEAPEASRRNMLRGGEGGGGVTEYRPVPNQARVIDLRLGADTLWTRVLTAYERLGLPLGEVDRAAGTLGTSTFRAVGRVGGTALGDYVDCGAGPLNTRAADTYFVYLRVTSELKPQPSPSDAPSTTLRTLVTATAKANNTQGDAMDCVSTGRLETRLVRLVAPREPATTGSAK